MIYSAMLNQEVLHSGEYKGYKFCILNMGTHPTAYVECKLKNCNSYDDERLDRISVHGGFTFIGEGYWGDRNNKYLGWDYAHLGDYAGYEEIYSVDSRNSKNKKWTTAEIFEEVKSVINQFVDEQPCRIKWLIKLKNFYYKYLKCHCPDCDGVMDSVFYNGKIEKLVYKCRDCGNEWV